MTDEEFMQLMQAGQQQPQEAATMPAQETATDEQKYLAESGPGVAAITGAGQALTFNQLDKLLSLIDDLTGASQQPGYIEQQRRTELLKQESPIAYGAGDIAGSVGMGLIPGVGQAAMLSKGVRGAQALGKAMPAVQAGLGALSEAGRGGDVADIITGGLLGGASSAAMGRPMAAMGRAAGRAIGGKAAQRAEPALLSQAKEARKGFREIRSTYEPTAEMKSVRQAQKAAEKARAGEQEAARSIFDEPASAMTAERATELQKQLYGARKAGAQATEAEKAAIGRAGPQFEAITQAQQRALDAERALAQNRQQIERLADRGGKIGEMAKNILSGPAIASVGDKLTEQQAEEIALIEAAQSDEEPSIGEIMDAAKTLMKLVD